MWQKVEDTEFFPSISWKNDNPLIGKVILRVSSVNAKSTWKFAGNLFQFEIIEGIGEARGSKPVGIDLGIATKLQFVTPTLIEFQPIVWLPDYRLEVWEWKPIIFTSSLEFSLESKQLLIPEKKARLGMSILNYGDYSAKIYTGESIKPIEILPHFCLPEINFTGELWGEAEEPTIVRINELLEE